jgi:hypothetical protein
MGSDGIAAIIDKTRTELMESKPMLLKFVTYDKLQ